MKKIIIAITVLLVLAVGALFSIPFFFKDRIIARAKSEIEKNINAKTSIKDIDLSLLKNIRNFPNIALGITDFVITGSVPFEGDTLIYAGNLKLSLDLMSVLRGDHYKIKSIELDNVTVNAVQNKDGIENWNILKPSEEKSTEPSSFKLALNKLSIDHSDIYYDDLKGGLSVRLQNFQHTGKGDFTSDILDYASETTIGKLSISQGIIGYLKDAKTAFNSSMHIDQKQGRYEFKDNKLTVNDLGLLFNGFIRTIDSSRTEMDIAFKADKTTFKSLLSLLPAIYSKDFSQLKSSGNVELNGSAKGILQGNSYPKFAVNLRVDNGSFQYPSLPTAVTKVFIDAHAASPGGSLDNAIIDVPDLRLNIANEPMTGKLKISTPVSDPDVELFAKGKLNLTDIQRIYPLKDVQHLQGQALVDLSVKAKKSDVDAKRYQNINAAGIIQAFGILYSSKNVPRPLSVTSLSLAFSPQYVNVNSCKGTIGRSDFDIKGKLENALGYMLSDDGVLKGAVSITSNKIDANEFLPDSSANKKSSVQKAKDAVRVPKSMDLSGKIQVGELLYDKIDLKNLTGAVYIRNEKVVLDNLNANLLGGHAVVNGYYATNTDIPTGNISYSISNFDMGQVFDFVGAMKKLAPVMKYVKGTFNSNSEINANINPDLSPDLKTLNGSGTFSIPSAIVTDLPALKRIIELTKLTQLSNLKVENLSVKATVANGRVIVDPFDLKIKTLKMTVGGSQGLDQSMDYTIAIDVPWKELGQASTFAQGLLAKNPIPGLNKMVPEVIRLNVKVGGFFNKPVIGMGKPEAGYSGNTLKDNAKQNIQQQVQQVKEAAKASVDSLKESAKQKLQDILTGNDTAKTNIKEDIKQNLKNRFGWPK
jgi:hypothetical protein